MMVFTYWRHKEAIIGFRLRKRKKRRVTYLKIELDKNCDIFPLNTNTIIELIKICVIDSKFTFNNKFYKQKFGLSMGIL